MDLFVSAVREMLDDIAINVVDSKRTDIDVRVLLEDGESQTTEFKSTLRTDVKGRGMPTKAVEYQCLKAINGFLNATEGGTLLIGVEDDRSIYGLEDDYDTFQEDQKQEVFRRHLYDLVGSSMEDRFNDFIQISFVTLEDRDICVVNVDQGPKPAFLEKEGNDKFYVRQGNRTIPLEPKQHMEYIREEFDEF